MPPLSARAEDPGAASPAAQTATPADAQSREQQFLYLLRTYPERRPDVTLGQVAQLIAQGPFAEQDRATFWIGSARLALGDRDGARSWFAKLAREHPDSVWVQRSYLGLAEAAAMERRFDESLRFYSLADQAKDPAVRELARIARPQVMTLQHRQHVGWLCGAILSLGCLALLWATLRAARASELARSRTSLFALARSALAPPSEARILWPLLGVVALASLRQDPAPRMAALELCLSGGVLVWLSGAYLRERSLTLPWRALHALGVLALLGCGAYLAIWRHDLVGMVQETWRAGPD